MAKPGKDKHWKLLVDSYFLCYRSYHSLPKDWSFKAHDTNIIYGFLSQVKKLAQDFNTCDFIFCFDSHRSYRKLIFPGYKNRESEPTEQERQRMAKYQFTELYEQVLPWMGFRNIYQQTGYESDDILAELCFRHPDDYIIISGDEDLFQLLSQGPVLETKMWNMKVMKTAENFQRTFGIKPSDWWRVKAIAGCKSDTVPGVDGAGDFKAADYIRGVLPEGKIKKRIEESRDIIKRNVELVALPFLGPRPLEVTAPVQDVLYAADFMDVFKEYGFGSFLRDEQWAQWKQFFNCQGGRRPEV